MQALPPQVLAYQGGYIFIASDEISCILSEGLLPCCTDTDCDEAILSASHDPHQFAYRPNRSTEDAISTTLYTVLTHLDQKLTYARILYIDFSSALIPSSP